MPLPAGTPFCKYQYQTKPKQVHDQKFHNLQFFVFLWLLSFIYVKKIKNKIKKLTQTKDDDRGKKKMKKKEE